MIELNNSFEFSPIVIHTYTRLEHLKKTIDALLKNDLACSTDLFIASDAPKDQKDEINVLLVRKYIKSISGFKSVNIILRDQNLGLHKNAFLAFEDVFKRTDRLISIEDDTIVGRGFLKFMNEGLSLYRGDQNVFAICGYLHKSAVVKSSSNAVLLTGFSAWGCGVWRDKFYDVSTRRDLALEFLRSPKLFLKLSLNRPDLILGVWGIAKHNIVAADLSFLLHMIKGDKKCLFPTKSLVRNIGNDGTGANCIADPSYGTQCYGENEIFSIGKNKEAHFYSGNPFFLALGGWKVLAADLFKFILLVIFGERFYRIFTNFKSSIKQKLFN